MTTSLVLNLTIGRAYKKTFTKVSLFESYKIFNEVYIFFSSSYKLLTFLGKEFSLNEFAFFLLLNKENFYLSWFKTISAQNITTHLFESNNLSDSKNFKVRYINAIQI